MFYLGFNHYKKVFFYAKETVSSYQSVNTRNACIYETIKFNLLYKRACFRHALRDRLQQSGCL